MKNKSTDAPVRRPRITRSLIWTMLKCVRKESVRVAEQEIDEDIEAEWMGMSIEKASALLDNADRYLRQLDLWLLRREYLRSTLTDSRKRKASK